jgi:DNA-binding NtrC family response regulator
LETTVRLDESIPQSASAGRVAVRWLVPGVRPACLPIDGARVVIGRGPEATASFEAAGLSRSHAEIYRQGPALIAHDLGSTNGTYVNGRRVVYAPLSEGDVLRLGDMVGVVVRPAAGAADPAADAAGLTELTPEIAFGPGVEVQLDQIRRAAPSGLPVVVVGETGTGKEYVAQAVHALGGRRGPFHAINCAALPPALAEAELFGHSKGAYTGADHAALGQVRAAHGGTLFLDELPELPLPVQAKLLRVLQERQVTPLGETRPVDVDLRVVAACQQPLPALVEGRRLREDLAARLAGVVVALPPLRARRADVGLYFRRFLERHAGGRPPAVDPRLLECLLLYDWPGNLRELDLLARRLVAFHAHEPVLRRSFLPESLLAHLPPADDAAPPGAAAPEAATGDRRAHDLHRLADGLRRHEGNLTRAATAAGISRARAYRLLGDRSVEELLAEVASGVEPPSAATSSSERKPRR